MIEVIDIKRYGVDGYNGIVKGKFGKRGFLYIYSIIILVNRKVFVCRKVFLSIYGIGYIRIKNLRKIIGVCKFD